MIEGRLRPLVHGEDGRPDRGVSPKSLRPLAQVQFERRLHDPAFAPSELRAVPNVSRTKLYGAFSAGEGVAAAIRDARLGRVRRHLSSSGRDGRTIVMVAYACGFTDLPAFNHAFRRRFGMTPRDVRGLRDA